MVQIHGLKNSITFVLPYASTVRTTVRMSITQEFYVKGFESTSLIGSALLEFQNANLDRVDIYNFQRESKSSLVLNPLLV